MSAACPHWLMRARSQRSLPFSARKQETACAATRGFIAALNSLHRLLMMLGQTPSSAGPTVGHSSAVPWLSSQTAAPLTAADCTISTMIGPLGAAALAAAAGAAGAGVGVGVGARPRTVSQPVAANAAA